MAFEQASRDRDRRLSASGPYYWQRNLAQVESPSAKDKGTGEGSDRKRLAGRVAVSPEGKGKRKAIDTELGPAVETAGGRWHIGKSGKKDSCYFPSNSLGTRPGGEAINSIEERRGSKYPEEIDQPGSSRGMHRRA
jgi:hypothetical protein